MWLEPGSPPHSRTPSLTMPIPTWLQRIALHLARDRQRARARGLANESLARLERDGDDTSEPADARAVRPGEEAERAELVRALSRALDRLPARLREAIVLRALEDRDYDELAQITGVRPATARTHVAQARRLLLRWLAPWLAPRDEPRSKSWSEEESP